MKGLGNNRSKCSLQAPQREQKPTLSLNTSLVCDQLQRYTLGNALTSAHPLSCSSMSTWVKYFLLNSSFKGLKGTTGWYKREGSILKSFWGWMSSWILEQTGKLINVQIFKWSSSKPSFHFLLVPGQSGPAPLKIHLTRNLTLGNLPAVTIQKKVRW